ncbi:MAG: hypothetical protein FWB97_05940 [Oscillospiraceae bacterium]|nr:hypothetical protein [Oscillospiraceae bacterium]
MLSLDMLKIVCAVEDESRQAIVIAKQRAKDVADEACKAGEEAIEATLARAKSEIAHLMRASDQKATEQAKELASTTANKLATLRARGERRLEATAQHIVERIVNS